VVRCVAVLTKALESGSTAEPDVGGDSRLYREDREATDRKENGGGKVAGCRGGPKKSYNDHNSSQPKVKSRCPS